MNRLTLLFLALAVNLGPFVWAAESTKSVIVGVSTRIDTLDPFLVKTVDSYVVLGNVIEPLSRIDPATQEWIPVLAESWKMNPNQNTLRVTLKKGVRFHNGDGLTAEDVKFTFEAFRNPKFKAAAWLPMWEGIQAVKVINPQVVEFQANPLKYQTATNIMTALKILPRSHYALKNQSKWRRELIGTGPYQVKSWNTQGKVELERNSNWHGGGAKIQHIIVKPVADPQAAAELMRKGQLDYYEIPSASALQFDQPIQEVDSAFGHGLALTLNLRNPKFQDLRVRNALTLLWNREALNKKVYGGRYQLALDIFSPRPTYYPKGKPVPYDLKLAQRNLKEAEAENLKFTVLVNSTAAERWVSLYQSDAAKAGVKVNIRMVKETSQWWNIIQDGKFEALAFEGGLSESVHPPTWHSKGEYNGSGFNDKKVDFLIDQLQLTFDPKKRAQIQRQMIEQIRPTRSQIPGLFSLKTHVLLSKRLKIDSQFPTLLFKWRLKD